MGDKISLISKCLNQIRKIGLFRKCLQDLYVVTRYLKTGLWKYTAAWVKLELPVKTAENSKYSDQDYNKDKEAYVLMSFHWLTVEFRMNPV